MDRERENFLKNNDMDISRYERSFMPKSEQSGTKEECNKVIEVYHDMCQKSNILSKLRDFFDDGFVKKSTEIIKNAKTYRDLRVILERYKQYKQIIKVTGMMEDGTVMRMNDIVISCIEKRVEYKYRCLTKEEKQDKNSQVSHNREILRHIFYKSKLEDLQKVWKTTMERYYQMVEEIDKNRALALERRKKEDERRKKEDEQWKTEDSERIRMLEEAFKESPIFEQVIGKKSKKSSRKKPHKGYKLVDTTHGL